MASSSSSSSSPSDSSSSNPPPIPPVPNADHDGQFPPLPVLVVTEPSQLPVEFLNPSPDHELVVGFDCEGVDLCRTGKLCVMQLAFPDVVYIVDAIDGGKAIMEACKPALESSHVTKVIHDCKRDSEALYFQFGIKLHNVIDTQIAFALIEEQEGRERAPDDNISLVSLVADPDYCGVAYAEKKEVRGLLRRDSKFWEYRPLSEQMTRAASDDVRFLLHIHQKMMEKLSKRSLWCLKVRGQLYCRCFCINDNDYADWPPLPVLPERNEGDGNGPEEQILTIINVPPGQMGRVIGKGGSTIRFIKESCNAEIFIGGSRGPPDKVFIIGPVREVAKAAAIARGRLVYF